MTKQQDPLNFVRPLSLDKTRTSVISPTESMKSNLMRLLERGRAIIVNPQATLGVILRASQILHNVKLLSSLFRSGCLANLWRSSCIGKSGFKLMTEVTLSYVSGIHSVS